MAKKEDNYYFDAFVNLVDYSCKTASMLNDIVLNFDYKTMEDKKNQIHLIEHAADLAKHEVTARLVKEFLPPIDREDVLSIIRDIDDVTDDIEDIALRLYMYDVKELNVNIDEFTAIIVRCCDALKELMMEFGNFKKSKKLRQLIIDVLSIEEECDILYTNAIHELYMTETDPIKINIWNDLLDRLENCCDACGFVSSTVETAYMRNL